MATMNFQDKDQLVYLLDNNKFEEAVELIKDKELDKFDMDIFLIGFDFDKIGLIKPIKDKFLSFDEEILSPRGKEILNILKYDIKRV